MSKSITREETLLNAIATGETVDIVPVTRKEKYLRYLAGIGEKPSKPITREEMFLDKIQAGGSGGGGGDEASILDSLIDGSITEITSNATSLVSYALCSRREITSVNFPLLTTTNYESFRLCTKLSTVYLPQLITVGEECFMQCLTLKTVDLPSVEIIDKNAFGGCNMLTALILRGKNVAVLKNTGTFSNSPIVYGTGYIYVPSAIIEDYKVATNWSNFATQFRTLEDYTVDGTITGELDESKIAG